LLSSLPLCAFAGAIKYPAKAQSGKGKTKAFLPAQYFLDSF